MLSRRELLRLALISSAAAGSAKSGWASLLSIDGPKPFVGTDIFAKLTSRVHSAHWDSLAIGDLTGEVGVSLLGTPYVGSTLEQFDDREVCCVDLTGLDCVTFYEVALCFARMIRLGGRTPSDLLKEVTLTRYRGGRLDGYLSRLHYTCDWIYDNARKGVVRDLTPTFAGAIRMDKRFDFMSTHPSSYRQLKANPSWVKGMADLENEISARKPWFVPNSRVAEIEPLLKTGDIVGIATSAAGLDCSHTGLVYVDENKICRFLNASSVKKQVVIGERLSEYAAKYKKNTGIMIARPISI
jgi:hypothetical protein